MNLVIHVIFDLIKLKYDSQTESVDKFYSLSILPTTHSLLCGLAPMQESIHNIIKIEEYVRVRTTHVT